MSRTAAAYGTPWSQVAGWRAIRARRSRDHGSSRVIIAPARRVETTVAPRHRALTQAGSGRRRRRGGRMTGYVGSGAGLPGACGPACGATSSDGGSPVKLPEIAEVLARLEADGLAGGNADLGAGSR